MKSSCFEDSIQFRESKTVGWCKIGWIRWVDFFIIPQFSRKCFTCCCRISRGLGAEGTSCLPVEIVTFPNTLQWPIQHLYVEFTINCFFFRHSFFVDHTLCITTVINIIVILDLQVKHISCQWDDYGVHAMLVVLFQNNTKTPKTHLQ